VEITRCDGSSRPRLQSQSLGSGLARSANPHVASMLDRSRKSALLSRAQTSMSVALGRDPDIAHAKLGVIRLDFNYPTEVGDVDNPESFQYPVVYRAVPGFTFQMCQDGKMTEEVEREFLRAIEYLDGKGCSVITGDCGFMLWWQEMAEKATRRAVIMSSLCVLPAVTTAYRNHGKIAIFSANGEMLERMHDVIREMCGVETHEEKYIIVGCEDVPGFEPIFEAGKLDIELATAGIVAKALKVCEDHAVHAFCFECTQLPPFSDAVRAATHRPVFDAITACDFFMSGYVDNPRFGLNDWHNAWEGVHEEYRLGDCLSPASKARLLS
jgi:hypothetical protein